MRYKRSDIPAYILWPVGPPASVQSKKAAKKKWKAAVGEEAVRLIDTPIGTDDVEIEVIYVTTRELAARSDTDNILKPTLDALTGVAFDDDQQVRHVTSTTFDNRMKNVVEGNVEDVQRLFYSGSSDVVTIRIYSDSRLEELGGPDRSSRERREEHLKESEKLAKLPGGKVVKARGPRR